MKLLENKIVTQIPSVLKVDSLASFAEIKGSDPSGFRLLLDTMPKEEKERVALIRFDGEHNGGSFLLFQIWNHKPGFLDEEKKSMEHKVGTFAETGKQIEKWRVKKRSHVSRMTIFDTNTQQRITCVRQSMPFDTQETKGKLFVGYARHTGNFELLLDRMVGKAHPSDDYVDYILSYSTCKGGQYYFVPSLDELLSF